MPVRATLHPAEPTGDLIPDGLIPGARIVADAYHQATGHTITRDALAERLRIPAALADRLLAALAATEPTTTSIQVPARLNHTTTTHAEALA